MEIIRSRCKLEVLPGAVRTVIDGAHNGESMRVLVSAVKKHFRFENLVYVIGVNSDKNIEEML